MRTYQPFWEHLRNSLEIEKNPHRDKSPEIKIKCAPPLQSRLIKAITKEKDMDEWKYKRYFRLISTKSKDGVTFYLQKYRKKEIMRAYISKNL